jgi:hypothetical protein
MFRLFSWIKTLFFLWIGRQIELIDEYHFIKIKYFFYLSYRKRRILHQGFFPIGKVSKHLKDLMLGTKSLRSYMSLFF